MNKLSKVTQRNIMCLLISMFITFISGCASSTKVADFSKEYEAPKATETQLTEHLACFGDMLSDYQRAYKQGELKPIRIAIVSVKDATNISTVDFANSEIPSNFNDMALGIVTKIGGPLRVLYIPDSNEIVDGLRLAGSGDKPFSIAHYATNTLQIYGALTEYDRLILNKQRELEVGAEIGDGSGLTNIEASRYRERNTARMTMDFRAVQPGVGDVINHLSSTNTLRLYQNGKDFNFGISVDGQGIGYAKSNSIVDARHKAIRLLIELGMIEVIGRYAKVPYWKCLTPENNHSVVKVKDILAKQFGNYDFSNEDYSNEQETGMQNKGNQSTECNNTTLATIKEPKEQEDHSKVKVDEDESKTTDPEIVECIDNRDADLIMGIAADYEYAEYIKLGDRSFVARPDSSFSLSGDPKSRSLNGRLQKLNALLNLYRNNQST